MSNSVTQWCPECGKAYTHECGVDGVYFTPDSLAAALRTIPVPATYEEWQARVDASVGVAWAVAYRSLPHHSAPRTEGLG